MKQTIVFVSVLILASTFSIFPAKNAQKILVQSSDFKNVGFDDRIGAGCKPGQVPYFVSRLNDASLFYRDDYRKSLDYTAAGLLENFGQAQTKYSVIAQLRNNSKYNFSIWVTNSEYATVSSGSDSILPNNSYMFIANYDQNNLYKTEYVFTKGAGNGITDDKKQVIDNIILSVEKTSCTCEGVEEITTKIKKFDGKDWSIVCSSNYDFWGRITVFNYQYYYATPKLCYYLIWTQD